MELVIEGISKSYGSKCVLNDVSALVSPGKVVALLGPNGVGKSTLLHILANILPCDSGAVSLGPYRLGDAQYAQRVGFCADDLPQPELLTAFEYLEMVAGLRGLPRPAEPEMLMLEGLRLLGSSRELIVNFSHGMKRKLYLVASLMHSPQVLILDEPFRGLDPESVAVMKRLLMGYSERGGSVLISTHDMHLAEQLCDEVIILLAERGVVQTQVGELRSAAVGGHLEDAFLELTGSRRVADDACAAFFEGLSMLNGRA